MVSEETSGKLADKLVISLEMIPSELEDYQPFKSDASGPKSNMFRQYINWYFKQDYSCGKNRHLLSCRCYLIVLHAFEAERGINQSGSSYKKSA